MTIKPFSLMGKINPNEVVKALNTLQSPDRLPMTAIENAVTSVNNQTGKVNVTLNSLNGQPRSVTLTAISDMPWGNQSILATDNSGQMTPVNYTSYSQKLLSMQSSADLVQSLGLEPGDSPVTSVNGEVGAINLNAEDVGAAEEVHTHTIEEVDDLSTVLATKMDKTSEISYSQIVDAPVIPAAQVQSDWRQTSEAAVDFIKNKPTLFSGDYNTLSNRPVLFSGKYSDLIGLPILSTVAETGSYLDLKDKPVLFDGSYNSLSNKPLIPPAQVNADWSATSGLSQVLNKPTLFSGDYADLTGKPILFSGSYSDLTNKPTIPAAQVNADWNATAGVSQILNKPTIPAVNYPVTSVNTKTGSVILTASDVGAAATSHTHVINDVTGLQTALNAKISVGANIPYSTLTGAPTIPAAQVQSDWNATTGLGVILNKPTIPTNTSQIAEGTNLYHTDARVQTYLIANNYRRVETLQGTTNASGVYQVIFANTYSVPPHVNPFIVNGTAAQIVTISNITNTGCTVTVQQRNSVTLLSVEVLLAATVPVANAVVGVLVVAKA